MPFGSLLLSVAQYVKPADPWLLVIMGEVYGIPRSVAACVKANNTFIARDNSRLCNIFLSDELLNLSPEEIKTVTWELDFYRSEYREIVTKIY